MATSSLLTYSASADTPATPPVAWHTSWSETTNKRYRRNMTPACSSPRTRSHKQRSASYAILDIESTDPAKFHREQHKHLHTLQLKTGHSSPPDSPASFPRQKSRLSRSKSPQRPPTRRAPSGALAVRRHIDLLFALMSQAGDLCRLAQIPHKTVAPGDGGTQRSRWHTW